MSEKIFQSSSEIIGQIWDYFARQDAGLERDSDEALARPTREEIAAIVEECFWTSLQQEEGRRLKLSLAYLPAEACRSPFVFERPFAFDASLLAKIAPAVERPGTHLIVFPSADGELVVWGYTLRVPLSSFVVEVAAPGLLVVKHRRRGQFSKYANVAVFTGNRAKFISETAGSTFDCMARFSQLLWRGTHAVDFGWARSADLLVRLALAMRSHDHGGTLLIVPSGSDAWSSSVAQPIRYHASPYHTELRELEHEYGAKRPGGRYKRAFARAIESVGMLTAVDGAAIVTDALDVIGFGAKIISGGRTPPREIMISEPVEGSASEIVPVWALGGTRHQSAAQFVHDQRDALALVASQDGRFTIFAWSTDREMVVASHVEALLL